MSRAHAHRPLELLVADVRQRPPRDRSGTRTGSRSSTGSRCPRACAGPAARRRPAASGRRSAGAEDRRPVELGGEDVGPEAAQVGVVAQPRVAHQLQDRAVELDHAVGRRSRARATPLRARWPWSKPCSNIRQRPDMRRCEWIVRPLSKRRKRCLPWVSMRRRARRRASPASDPGHGGAGGWRSAPAAGPPAGGAGAGRSTGWCLPRASPDHTNTPFESAKKRIFRLFMRPGGL